MIYLLHLEHYLTLLKYWYGSCQSWADSLYSIIRINWSRVWSAKLLCIEPMYTVWWIDISSYENGFSLLLLVNTTIPAVQSTLHCIIKPETCPLSSRDIHAYEDLFEPMDYHECNIIHWNTMVQLNGLL